MNLDTQLLILISVMIALGLFGMYQWRKLLEFVYSTWIPVTRPMLEDEIQKQGRQAEDIRLRREEDRLRREDEERQGGGDLGGRFGGGSTYSE